MATPLPEYPSPKPINTVFNTFVSVNQSWHTFYYHWQVPRPTEFKVLTLSLFSFSPVLVRGRLEYRKEEDTKTTMKLMEILLTLGRKNPNIKKV